MQNRTALVFGGTGLVGRNIVEELISTGYYSEIKVFLRRQANYNSEKVKEIMFDFQDIEKSASQVTGDDLFICIGTTIRKAGSVKKMEETDRDLPVRIAGIAFRNGVKRIAVVSSIGANEKSPNYYLRIKGEMECGISASGFQDVAIVRPSLLLGRREERRFGEGTARIFMSIFGFLFRGNLRKYRGIDGRDVARAMVKILKEPSGMKIYESDVLEKISRG